MSRKKSARLAEISLRPGATVILEKLPPGLLDGLPAEDQAAISAIVGVPIRFLGFDEDGRSELEFVEENGIIHHIYVDGKFVKTEKSSRRKLTKRRK